MAATAAVHVQTVGPCAFHKARHAFSTTLGVSPNLKCLFRCYIFGANGMVLNGNTYSIVSYSTYGSWAEWWTPQGEWYKVGTHSDCLPLAGLWL